MYRTADHDVAVDVPKLCLSNGAELPQNDRDKIFQGVLFPEDIGLAKQPTGQVRLQGLHQTPPAVSLEIASDRLWPRQSLRLTVRGEVFGVEVQHRPEGRGAVALPHEAREHGCAIWGRHGDRAIGGAKVESDRSRHSAISLKLWERYDDTNENPTNSRESWWGQGFSGDDPRHYKREPLSLGSRTSRRASPRKLKDNTTRKIARPGEKVNQGAWSMVSKAPRS